MGLLYQIKARVTQRVQMEPLPFLSKNEEPQSRSHQEEVNEWPAQREREPQPMFMPMPSQKQNMMDVFRGANPMAILLLGIVIGVIVVSMRPIVIQSMKAA